MGEYKRLNPTLSWLWDLISFISKEEIKVPDGYNDQVEAVKEVLKSDTSGIVNSILDFAINIATVDFTIEVENLTFKNLIQNWFSKINYSLLGKIPTGVKALAKEYYKERWKGSSFLLLRTQWEHIDIEGTKFNLPTKMWFVDGENIVVKDESASRIVGAEQYYLKVNSKQKLLPTRKDELIFVQKPYSSWSFLYPIPFIIQRGLYKNLQIFDLMNTKGEKIIGRALEYLLSVKKGTEGLALKGLPEFTYSKEDLKEVKEELKKLIDDAKSSSGTPTAVSSFDTEIEHIIPDYSRALNIVLYTPLERRLLAGLGIIDIIQGISSARRESLLNPKPFIAEVENAIEDFISLLSDVMTTIKERNLDIHRKYFADKIQLHYTPIRQFIDDSLRDHLRSMYDRGVLSKQTYAEVIGGVDYDIEVTRRLQETKAGHNIVMYPPLIQNREDIPDLTLEELPDKTGPEAKNYKGTLEVKKAICKDCQHEFDVEITPEFSKEKLKCPKCEKNNIELSEILEEAPYKKVSDLPDSVKNNLDSDLAQIFLRVVNDALDRYGDDTTAFKVAWSVIRRIAKKGKDGKWHRKSKIKSSEGKMIELEEASIQNIIEELLDLELKEKRVKLLDKLLKEKEDNNETI